VIEVIPFVRSLFRSGAQCRSSTVEMAHGSPPDSVLELRQLEIASLVGSLLFPPNESPLKVSEDSRGRYYRCSFHHEEGLFQVDVGRGVVRTWGDSSDSVYKVFLLSEFQSCVPHLAEPHHRSYVERFTFDEQVRSLNAKELFSLFARYQLGPKPLVTPSRATITCDESVWYRRHSILQNEFQRISLPLFEDVLSEAPEIVREYLERFLSDLLRKELVEGGTVVQSCLGFARSRANLFFASDELLRAYWNFLTTNSESRICHVCNLFLEENISPKSREKLERILEERWLS
jgi:hypothetical protein